MTHWNSHVNCRNHTPNLSSKSCSTLSNIWSTAQLSAMYMLDATHAGSASVVVDRRSDDQAITSYAAVWVQYCQISASNVWKRGRSEDLTLNAMVRMASDMLIISCRSLASSVALTRNSSRLSPTCGTAEDGHLNVPATRDGL